MKKSLCNIVNSLGRSILLSLLAAFCLFAAAPSSTALPLETYASASVLGDGRWVKVSVGESGVYALTSATLRRMGFTDPSRVRVYGYGGRQIADRLNAANYVDDLPQVQTMLTDRGSVVFYAQGPDYWVRGNNGRYNKNLSLYTTRGYYFVTEVAAGDTAVAARPAQAGRPGDAGAVSSFTGRIHYERNINAPGESGAELVGEDFRLTPTRRFTFDLEGRDEADSVVYVECSFVTKTFSRSSTVELTAGGRTRTQTISSTLNDAAFFGTEGSARHAFAISGSKLDLTLTHKSPVTVHAAWLNYLTVNYTRTLTLPASGALSFALSSPSATLGGAVDGVRVWDVTDPMRVLEMQTGAVSDGRTAWVNSYTGHREYVAFNPAARLPEPVVEGNVANQNLHAMTQADMIIVTLPPWRSQAERIAALHTSGADSLGVEIVDAARIYNEFGSGAADPGALRRFFKMVYDRSADAGRPLRYVLLMGRYSYDCAGQTEDFRRLGVHTIPSWYPSGIDASLSDRTGYGTDDVMAMLADNSGTNLGSDKLSVAIGRMPVRDLEEATSDVDKLYEYVNSSRNTTWRNQMLYLVDDGDNGAHMNQANTMDLNVNPEDSPNFVANKVYMDAYERVGDSFPMAREAMFRYLNEGAMFWVYLGHANPHQWSHDKQLTTTDINSLYLKHLPVLFAGTCEFLRWDSNTESGGEVMFHERFGGVISMISATRPVYISDNGLFSAAMGRALGSRDELGRIHRVGDLYRIAKNDIRNYEDKPVSDTNRLRYVLMGDPAMKLAAPDNRIILESVNGVPVMAPGDTEGDAPVITALSRPRLTGIVTDPMGNPISDFNGSLHVTIFDAARSTTTNGWGTNGAEVTFQEHGSKLYNGIISVKDGRFDSTIAMPSEIADNYRPALASFYAYDESARRHAAGVSAGFYVYGLDESALPDTVPPVIDAIFLNGEDFADGGRVNLSPTLIARVSDDVGINISTAGVGRQMTVRLDGNRSYSDVAEYFTPSADGSPSGEVAYTLENLTEGSHTLEFSVWDTSGNSASASIDFVVDAGSVPRLYDVYTDSNPAVSSANFYVTTDRPNQLVTVTITVYNLMGREIWSKTVRGRNDLFTTTPVNWDLCDSAGRRVPRGIYLYRASVSDNDETYVTVSRRIAVAAQ